MLSMSNLLSFLQSYWWVGAILLSVVLYKFILRVVGVVIVPEDRIGLVTKKFVLFGPNKSLPDGKIIALNGEPGYQAKTLAPGLYWGYWPWQYDINLQPFRIIAKGKIGLVSAKDGAQLPTGAILARHVDSDDFQDAKAFLTNGGQRGKQVSFINAGTYRINSFLFDIVEADITPIKEGSIGVVTALDGTPLDAGNIAGKEVNGHNNFQNFDTFLANGGQRGLQTQVIQAGNYSLNPWAVQIEEVPMTPIPIGHVGVVISYVGDDGRDVTGEGFKHGNIVNKGQKGVWITPYDPGKYAINPYTTKIEIVPTTNLVLNWANARTESHNLDKGLSTITVRSKDGFPFNLDVSQIIHIPAPDAPKVIARFGSMQNLVSQVLEPTIGNYFRNSAQDSDVISFLSTRQARQEAAKVSISKVLEDYNVHAVDTLIGDITPPESLMKTLTDRKIAQEERETFNVQQKAQEEKQKFESAKALAEMQGQIVSAEQSVMIADRKAQTRIKEANGEAESTKLRATAQAEATKVSAEANAYKTDVEGKAEAGKIAAIGEATAKSYEQQVHAMGAENFSKFKITEEIGKNNIKIIPQVLITGGNDSGNGAINGLLGMNLLNQIQVQENAEKSVKATEVKPTEVKA
jgi:uncharacterized membrane protein YqiK